METKKVLAVDLGASSGRVMLGSFDGEKITVEELHRFSNDPVILGNTMYWDFLRLFHEIKQGLIKSKAYGKIDSISVDTWGVDFGLLDKEGNLLGNPVHYRDARVNGMLDKSFEKIDKDTFYGITGNQFMEINTVFQLLYLALNKKELLEQADSLLMMPDLFNYYLSGGKCCEYSIASTTQMLDAVKKNWSDEVIEKLGLPARLLQQVVPSGTTVGTLSPQLCEVLGIEPMKVVAGAGHDTQCALAAVPTGEKDFIFISCGTWCLFGTELDEPIIDENSARFNITNEGGVGGKISFLKNIIGLWLIQESRRQWKREGEEYSYADLERMALSAEPFKCFIDPDSPEFTPPGDIPGRVREFCRKTGQYVPQTVGEVMRCIYESLAMKYRSTFSMIKECTGRDYPDIHVIGGGTKDTLLCQMTANACNVPVKAGPIEATVLGNIAVQLLSSGDIQDIKKAREIISRSEALREYAPCDTDKWAGAYESFLKILK